MRLAGVLLKVAVHRAALHGLVEIDQMAVEIRAVHAGELGLAADGQAAGAGAFYRLALIPMIFTMCIAFFVIHGADPFAVKELALVYLAIFVLMYIAGPGNYSVDRLIAKKIGGGK